MPIVFADEARRRRRRRLAGKAAVALAIAAGGFAAGTLLAGGSDSDASDKANPAGVQTFAGPSLVAQDQTIGPQQTDADFREEQRSPNAPSIDCEVTDGDTLNCGGRRIRLIGIDAPELPGHCREGRDCVEGDPFAASTALQTLIKDADLEIVVSGRDSYDRELANVYANGKNVACDLIAGGSAIYIAKWDDGGKVREDCALSGL